MAKIISSKGEGYKLLETIIDPKFLPNNVVTDMIEVDISSQSSSSKSSHENLLSDRMMEAPPKNEAEEELTGKGEAVDVEDEESD